MADLLYWVTLDYTDVPVHLCPCGADIQSESTIRKRLMAEFHLAASVLVLGMLANCRSSYWDTLIEGIVNVISNNDLIISYFICLHRDIYVNN